MTIKLFDERDMFWWEVRTYVVTAVIPESLESLTKKILARHLDMGRRGSRRYRNSEHFGNGEILTFQTSDKIVDDIEMFGKMNWSAFNVLMDRTTDHPERKI